jgi:predicted nucleotidyltransferase
MRPSMPPALPPEFDTLVRLGDPFERRLYFAAILTKYAAERGGQFVIVGGHAVEYYTDGGYATQDADLLTPNKLPLAQLLIEWGFKLEGRVYWHPGLRIVIDLIDDRPSGDPERIAELDVRGLTVRIAPVEEVIIDRLNAGVHWRSEEALRWARAVLLANAVDVDWEYLQARAAEDQVSDALAAIRPEVKGDG